MNSDRMQSTFFSARAWVRLLAVCALVGPASAASAQGHVKNGAALGPNQRAAEARALVAQLAGVRARFDDRDIVMIGDTNW